MNTDMLSEEMSLSVNVLRLCTARRSFCTSFKTLSLTCSDVHVSVLDLEFLYHKVTLNFNFFCSKNEDLIINSFRVCKLKIGQ